MPGGPSTALAVLAALWMTGERWGRFELEWVGTDLMAAVATFDAVLVNGMWARSGARAEALRWVLRPSGPGAGRGTPQTCRGRFCALPAAPSGAKFPARSFRAGLTNPIPNTNTASNVSSTHTASTAVSQTPRSPHLDPAPSPPYTASTRMVFGGLAMATAMPGGVVVPRSEQRPSTTWLGPVRISGMVT